MAKFHGPVNLHLGEPVWAAAEYDHEARTHVIEVSGKDVAKFRKVADMYGFVEQPSEQEPVEDETPDADQTEDA